MKIKKEVVIGLFVIAAFAAAIMISQVYQRQKNRNDLASRIMSISSGGPPETIEGLRTAIAAYEQQIEAHVRDAAQTGVYYKILATRLQDRALHNEALIALERALYYNPTDATLHYMAGVSLAYVAKSYAGFSRADNAEKERYYALSEEHYLAAITMDGRYLRPRFGIGILYVFELDRPEDAIPHLEFYLGISRNDIDTMFVLARAYFLTGAFEKAVDIYDRIINLTRDSEKRSEARSNRQYIMELIYEYAS